MCGTKREGLPYSRPTVAFASGSAFCVDIDHRKRSPQQQIEAEKALREVNEILEQRVEAEARERYRIWNVSQVLLAVSNAEGKIISVNPAWTATLGWSEDDLLSTTGEWLVHSDDLERIP